MIYPQDRKIPVNVCACFRPILDSYRRSLQQTQWDAQLPRKAAHTIIEAPKVHLNTIRPGVNSKFLDVRYRINFVTT
jgi:hypothetical protein